MTQFSGDFLFRDWLFIAVYLLTFHFNFQINVAVQCLSTDFSSQKGVKVRSF